MQDRTRDSNPSDTRGHTAIIIIIMDGSASRVAVELCGAATRIFAIMAGTGTGGRGASEGDRVRAKSQKARARSAGGGGGGVGGPWWLRWLRWCDGCGGCGGCSGCSGCGGAVAAVRAVPCTGRASAGRCPRPPCACACARVCEGWRRARRGGRRAARARGRGRARARAPGGRRRLPDRAQVAVVGGGPAGLAAACALRARGPTRTCSSVGGAAAARHGDGHHGLRQWLARPGGVRQALPPAIRRPARKSRARTSLCATRTAACAARLDRTPPNGEGLWTRYNVPWHDAHTALAKMLPDEVVHCGAKATGYAVETGSISWGRRYG